MHKDKMISYERNRLHDRRSNRIRLNARSIFCCREKKTATFFTSAPSFLQMHWTGEMPAGAQKQHTATISRRNENKTRLKWDWNENEMGMKCTLQCEWIKAADRSSLKRDVCSIWSSTKELVSIKMRIYAFVITIRFAFHFIGR